MTSLLHRGRTFALILLIGITPTLVVATGNTPAGAATPGTWTGWTTNSSGCRSAARVPTMSTGGQILGVTQVYCPTTTTLTIRARLRSDRTGNDVTVNQNGCSDSAGTCAISVTAGYHYYYLACPKTSTRVTHGYHTDIIIYPGANVYAASGATSGSTTQSPYCAN